MSLGKVLIQENNLKRANFDFSHDAPTTLEFGYMQPVHFKLVNAGTRSRVSTSSTTYFAPLTTPTHGKIYLHEYTQFVPMSSIFKQFPYFLAQLSRLNRHDSNPAVPAKLPRISGKVLMWFLSKHGHSQYYLRDLNSDGTSATHKSWILWTVQNPVVNRNFRAWGIPDDHYIDVNTYIPRTLSTKHQYYFNPSSYDYSWFGHYPKEGSSIIQDHRTLLKLNKLGSRLNDIFLCCGMKPTMDDSILYDATFLFGLYKAYWDIMMAPLSQYTTFESSSLCKLLKYYDQYGSSVDITMSNIADTTKVSQNLYNLWSDFIDDLTIMYYTSNADYLSVHLPVDFANANPLTNTGFMDVSNYEANSLSHKFDYSAGGTLNPLSKTQGSQSYSLFSQLSDEWCKKAYYTVNKRSQLGYALKKELKMRGYKDWCYDNDSKYINHTRTLVPITQLQNQSDTLQVGQSVTGDVVGSRSGNAQLSTKTFASTHYANETGFIIHFVCLVPERRICNGASEDALTTDVLDWYSPSTDGFGYQATPRICVGAQDNVEIIGSKRQSEAFGLIPRHFGKKISNNIKLGGFALRSQKTSYDNFYLDMCLENYGHETEQSGYDASTGSFQDLVTANMIDHVPDASFVWRQFACSVALDKYDRIFDYRGSSLEHDAMWYDRHFGYPASNVVCLLEVEHKATAHMLPTSKTWETIECEDDDKDLFSHEK